MAIRLRKTEIGTVAICAARSVPKDGDTYLDDDAHHALSQKFAADFESEGFYDGPMPGEAIERITAREESNNENREDWDRRYAQ